MKQTHRRQSGIFNKFTSNRDIFCYFCNIIITSIYTKNSNKYPTILTLKDRDFITTIEIEGETLEEYKNNFIENVFIPKNYRRLTISEIETLQTVPYNYTHKGIDEDGIVHNISETQRHKMLGNGWTIDVISHLFGGIYDEIEVENKGIDNDEW